jgi:methionine-gamma-lyase
MLEAMRGAAKKGRLKMIFLETPSNPTNTLVDFEALLKAVDTIEKETGHRPLTVCDNTMLGPVFQQVIPNGLDIAVYSVTKYIGGHSDLVAGAVCGSREVLTPIRATRNLLGLNLDPHTSWMIARSLETLTIRAEKSAATGSKVAQWLSDNPYIKVKVHHPEFAQNPAYKKAYERQCSGPGSTFSFCMSDFGKKEAFAIINGLTIFKSAVSLGGNESLVCHPASTTHSGVPLELREKVGVTDGLIRLSIGLEHADDLIADLDNAFKLVFKDAQAA